MLLVVYFVFGHPVSWVVGAIEGVPDKELRWSKPELFKVSSVEKGVFEVAVEIHFLPVAIGCSDMDQVGLLEFILVELKEFE